MAYKCPRCGAPVERGYSTDAQIAAGLVGTMFYAAFGKFVCKNCGKIPKSEFPPEARAKMDRISFLLVIGAIAIGIAAFWVLMNIEL